MSTKEPEKIKSIDAEYLSGRRFSYQENIAEIEDVDLLAATPGEDLNWLEDVELLEEEGTPAVFDRYSNSFLKIYFQIPAGREDEIAHDKVRAEEMRQTQEADRVMREYQTRLEAVQAQAQQEADGLRREVADIQRRTNEELENKQREMEVRVADLKQDRDALQARYDDLSKRFASLDAQKDREWNARVNALKQDRDRWSEEANALMGSSKRSGWYAAGLAIIGVIAALAIGFLLGMVLMSSQPVQVSVSSPQSTYSTTQPETGTNSTTIYTAPK